MFEILTKSQLMRLVSNTWAQFAFLEKNFCDFLFISLDNKAILTLDLLLKENSYPKVLKYWDT